MKYVLQCIVMACFCVAGISALAAESGPAVALDLNHASRTHEEKARDVNRQPQETLSFFGLTPQMRVIELFPGGGWYTKLLGPYLKDEGALYLALNETRAAGNLEGWGLSHVIPTGEVVGFTKTDLPGYIFSIDSIDLGQTEVDMVLTFRNAHNLTPEARMKLNRAVYAALKPGGIYGVIDHTKRHMQGIEKWTWRRADPVQIIKETIDAGFEFVDYTDIHARPEDELKYDTRHDSLVNETDRFTLKFRKPE